MFGEFVRWLRRWLRMLRRGMVGLTSVNSIIALFSFVERFVLVVDKTVLCESGGGCCSFILTVTVFCIM